MKDIVERLYDGSVCSPAQNYCYNYMTMQDAAAEIERLRACLENTRDEICEGPVDDTLWHTAVPACTTVDNITLALRDGWTYDGWLDAKSTQA